MLLFAFLSIQSFENAVLLILSRFQGPVFIPSIISRFLDFLHLFGISMVFRSMGIGSLRDSNMPTAVTTDGRPGEGRGGEAVGEHTVGRDDN